MDFSVENLKKSAVPVALGLYLYHNGYLNFIFGEPSKAGIKQDKK